MKHELEPIGRSVLFSPAVKVSPIGLEWLTEPTPDELDADDYTVQRCEGSVAWWMGDIICKRIDIALRKREEALSGRGRASFLTQEDRHDFMTAEARKYAENKENIEEGIAIRRAHVSSFYPISRRIVGLTWGHHHEAWGVLAGDGLDEAMSWLRKALAGSWSCATLRAELRKAKAQANPERMLTPGLLPEEVVDIERWASTEWSQIKRADAQHAQWLLSQMPVTLRVVDHLRTLASAVGR